MAGAPYTQTYRRNDNLCFRAEVPALANIGARFDEVADEQSNYEPPASRGSEWHRLKDRLADFVDQARQGTAPEWPVIKKEFEKEFGDGFKRLLKNANQHAEQLFKSGQLSLEVHLTGLLLSHTSTGLTSSDPTVNADAIASFMDITQGKSPRRSSTDDTTKAPQTPFAGFPGIPNLPGLGAFAKFLNAMPTFEGLTAGLDDDDDGESKSRTKKEATPPGVFQFSCGPTHKISPAQVALFEQFIEQQQSLGPQIEAALRDLHGQMDSSWEADEVLFPEDPGSSDIPLQCFRIDEITLESEKRGRVVLELDSHFGHFDEHGCYILIRDGKVERYGEWDEVLGGEEDEDDDDFDDEE